jgi:small subunit ribosomal protein S9
MAEENTFSATGRRKAAVARVKLASGKGDFMVNGRPVADYLTRETLVRHAQAPLEITEMAGKLNVYCDTRGGGKSGQAGAIRLAVSRALVSLDAELRTALRRGGFLTRDPRQVERKKYGQPKARKRFQYSKR